MKIEETAISQLGFSARACDKALRLARTIAGLDHSDNVQSNHVGEATQYRTGNREMF